MNIPPTATHVSVGHGLLRIVARDKHTVVVQAPLRRVRVPHAQVVEWVELEVIEWSRA